NTSEGYALLSHSLSTAQRDFRVYNTFINSGANNNVAPDTQFPGAQGAVMAIWKGCIEWGSRLHGNGNGDSTQNGDLGSGGANFDATFQGEANYVGTLGDNICSTVSGTPNGVLAYTEINGSGSWRMRFYDSWNWADGPGSISGSQMDMQSVACHEYGHALGMDHSANAQATMAPAIGNGQTSTRSINFDDIAGVQAKYGVAGANKPIVSGITSAVLGQITITGSNFGANNEVWFTRQNFVGTGTPLTVGGVASTNGGTQIVVSVPNDAQSGDVLVRNTSLSGGVSLSNAWPFDISSIQCPGQGTVCTGFPNSTGATGELYIFGSQNVAANDTVLTAAAVPANQFGLFVYGQGSGLLPVSNGIFCLNGSAFYRLGIVQTTIFQTASYNLDLNNLPPGGQISAGQTWNFQFWHRENGGVSNFTDAVSYTFCN
ncbi:MAG TPA: matrixin family metalloprotease, partial [Planctomycetota bacterium]|nr:matrixin family metalloprotease [Planctomycetota bacterium]